MALALNSSYRLASCRLFSHPHFFSWPHSSDISNHPWLWLFPCTFQTTHHLYFFCIPFFPLVFFIYCVFGGFVWGLFLNSSLVCILLLYVYAITAAKGNSIQLRFRSWIQWTRGDQTERSLPAYSSFNTLNMQRCNLQLLYKEALEPQ